MIKTYTLPQGNATSPDVNMYWDTECKILFDCGPDEIESFLMFKNLFEMDGNSIRTIKAIVITHHHIDHLGGLKYFPKSIPVILNKNVLRFQNVNWNLIQSSERVIGNLIDTEDIKNKVLRRIVNEYDASNSLYDRKIITADPTSQEKVTVGPWTFVSTMGHSSSDLIAYNTLTKIAITGDIILPKIFFNAIIELDNDLQNLTSFRNEFYDEMDYILEVNPKLLYIGHGEPLDYRRLTSSVNNTIKRMHRTERKITKAISDSKNINLTEMIEKIFKTFIPYDYFLPFSEVTSIYLDNKHDLHTN